MTTYSLDVILSQFGTNLSTVPCPILTVLLDLQTRFSGGSKVVWYSHLLKNFPQFFSTVDLKGFSIVSEAEADVFLEFSCFL